MAQRRAFIQIMETDFESMEVLCMVCKKRAEVRCSRCKCAWYCSAECQLRHWRAYHKNHCTSNGIDYGNGCVIPRSHWFEYNNGRGCCLDCNEQGVIKPTTYFCDRCHRPTICPGHEGEHRVCLMCRGCSDT